ncbi:MAG TPA: hypothetical protein VKT33_12150 [Candidatus Angelobacter sp.]|nr:hypothetical protein [Candidatus Angelobacter sp.]
MRTYWLRAVLLGLLGIMAGCEPINNGHSTAGGTMVTVTFTGGTPLAAATQSGTGTFTAATITGGKLSLTVPQGTTKYAIAWVCPGVAGSGNTVNSEFVIEATTQDPTSFSTSCLGPATSTVTGSANASLITSATDINIAGNQGLGGNVGSNSGNFSVSLPNGNNDIAAVAVDGTGTAFAVHMVRGQTVPGVINGGNTILFVTADSTATQPLTVTGVPAGFVSPASASVQYRTANGTSFLLENNSATQYPAVPAAQTQTGDFYVYHASTTDTATHNSSVGITQSTTTGGGSTSIALPVPWSFAGPAAAKFPTFTFNYNGFNGLADVSQQAEIEWVPTANTLTTITVTATANFQNGMNTITVPDLTTVSGFFAPAATGTSITWVADIFGGTAQEFTFFPNIPANGTVSFVQNRGSFTQP